MRKRLCTWAAALKRDVLALSLAGRDPRVPWMAKVLAIATAAYALSPIDLIPDVIPVLGYLDDLVLLPLAIWLAIRLIPTDVMESLRTEAAVRLAGARPRSLLGLALVLGLWACLAGTGLWLWLAWT